MRTLRDVLPDDKTLLALEPDELGAVIVELVQERGNFNRGFFGVSELHEALYPVSSYARYPNDRPDNWTDAKRDDVLFAIAESVAALERLGLVIQPPNQGSATTWRVLTRQGRVLKSRQMFEEFRQAAGLPFNLLHPRIARVSAGVLPREGDTAVFRAFKEVEIAVREAAGYADDVIGVPLMRRAFDPAKGPLTDQTLVMAEREGISNLFAGAIAVCKNPVSHRNHDVERAEAFRLLLFSSYLMALIEERLQTASLFKS